MTSLEPSKKELQLQIKLLVERVSDLEKQVQDLQADLNGLARATAETSRITSMFTPIG